MNFDFSKLKVMVLGEVGIDEFISGTSTRQSPEADVPVVTDLKRQVYPGMSANLANQLATLGASVRLFTVLGNSEHYELFQMLKSDITYQYVNDRPLIRKTRLSSNGSPLVRIDDESTAPLHPADRRMFLESFIHEIKNYDAVFLQDYGKGLWDTETLREVMTAGKPVFVDPFPDRPLMAYSGCFLIKPNFQEAVRLLSVRPGYYDAPESAALGLQETIAADIYVVTSGANGCTYVNEANCVNVPAVPAKAVDVSGAGDTFMAVLGLSLLVGNSLLESLRLANKAGAVVVQKPGTANVTLEELTHE